ncbi:hypothetical protein [Sediminibacterium sp.]|uniref:hypothetical protein n=1 Tax=Sediminibacterium sp. TaxID=1917865 RepID=UPI0025CB965E|nr:hypothetical protein [Sediminibacterium sp.]MBW0177578.1 hypothetical protein [Sediminibacterium sp.]
MFFTKAQPFGNFNGIYNSNGNNGHYEKLLQTSVFPNNVPNLAVDVLLGNYAFWGYIEIEITGDYSHQNTPGKLSKLFAIGINPNGYIYTNESRVTDAIGAVVDNISIVDFAWDAVNNRYRIPVSHTVSTQNVYTVKVKLFSQGDGASNIGSQLAISSQYSLNALPRNAVNYNQDMGIGTTAPKNLLHLHGAADGYGYLRISDALTGNLSTDGARIGFNSGAFRIQNYENSKMSFHVNGNTEALTINSNGNIGIGVVNPVEKLVVDGAGIFSGNIVAHATGSRPISLTNLGSIISQGDNGGWAFGYHARGSAGTDRGGFGFYGSGNGLDYYYVGDSYANPTITTYPDNGNVGIGTRFPSDKLSVNGNIRAKKLIVSQTGWPDYVFDPAYKLKPLSELSAFIQKHQHLPDMPSAKEVEEKGISVGDNQALLLKKIEELTLYLIEMKKEITELKSNTKSKKKK